MPLDQRGFEIETKHEVFSLEGLIAWLETQPGDEPYDLYTSNVCLLGQYTASCGGELKGAIYSVGAAQMPIAFGIERETAEQKQLLWVAYNDPHTFGAALTRARQALRDRAQP